MPDPHLPPTTGGRPGRPAALPLPLPAPSRSHRHPDRARVWCAGLYDHVLRPRVDRVRQALQQEKDRAPVLAVRYDGRAPGDVPGTPG